ncbi:MAG: hypothetical protein CVU05_06730 [Bacteroidetes bacterium HGW-Bacteroidetes-21]|nr:MAG: hypothetical protein CVU05_06730 [Bacteroidetes bacterium HGW-Bacteroidetes-21]
MLISFFYSCNTTEENKEQQNNIIIEEDETVPSLTTIKVPSPVELYMFMYNAGLKFEKTLLNPADRSSKYVTTYKKSLNFGIYASDLAYCTVFKQNKETFSYFSTTKKLADDLGLTEGFDEAIVKRIDQNISNSDSLYKITNDSYSNATSFIEQQGQGALLPLMLTGAWIESVNIASKSIKTFSADDEIVLLIADQQFLLESILEMFESIPEEDNFPELVDKLKDIQQSFDKLYDNADVRITQKQYDEIVTKVKILRAEIVG